MKNLRRNFERFCYRHQNKGIRNLMLYIVIGTVILFFVKDRTGLLVNWLRFDHTAILQGQVWRLFTYVLIPAESTLMYPTGFDLVLFAISMYFYYVIGRAIERHWGVFRFNLYYLCGVLITDIGALLLGMNASVDHLNLSLVLAFATMFPENRVLLFMIIPLKMKYLAWFYFAVAIWELVTIPLPFNLFSVFALLNYFLFFGSSVLSILPDFMRRKKSGFGRFQTPKKKQKPNPHWADSYKSSAAPTYRHKCTVCGRTDASNPELEFRYCSKCSGYYCYCLDHINNHAHIE